MKRHIFTNPLALAIILSFSSWYITYRLGLSTAYNDAMSHLNLSRLIIDNIEPGISQIGGVWLPLTHLLPLVLIWNDWAWHSGFAGSIFSMAAYIVSVWAIFDLIFILTKNRLASLLGSAVFALNLNMLYLQSTPLTEPIFLAFFILSSLYFTKWIIGSHTPYLLLIGLFGFLQVLTRYDGWFVVICEALLILANELLARKRPVDEVIGKLFVFGSPIVFGISSWLLWNFLIFEDPLFFLYGPYSAHAQQSYIDQSSTLITKGNIFVSSLAYWYAALNNLGIFVVLISFAGLLFFLMKFTNLQFHKRFLIISFLSTPILFNILALYFGFSILNLPELNWNPSNDPGARWFNVRYGIFALPLSAFLIGFFAHSRRFLPALIAAEIIIMQAVLMLPNNIITVIDGVSGSSSFANKDISKELASIAQPSDTILLSVSFFNPVAFESNIRLKQIIHEGVSRKWPYSIVYPEKYASLIVMANGDVGDPVYTTLVRKQKERFLKHYDLIFAGKHANIYKRVDQLAALNK